MAMRMVSKTLQLERDPHNHPIYLVRKKFRALPTRCGALSSLARTASLLFTSLRPASH